MSAFFYSLAGTLTSLAQLWVDTQVHFPICVVNEQLLPIGRSCNKNDVFRRLVLRYLWGRSSWPGR